MKEYQKKRMKYTIDKSEEDYKNFIEQKKENSGAAPDKNEKSLVQRMDEAVARRDQMLDKLDNIQNELDEMYKEQQERYNRLKRMKELEDMMRQNYHYQEGLYWPEEW